MKDLNNTKIWIGNNPALSELVQTKLFGLGYRWFRDNLEVRLTNAKALYINEDSISYSNNLDYFTNSPETELNLSDLGITEKDIANMSIISKARKDYPKGTFFKMNISTDRLDFVFKEVIVKSDGKCIPIYIKGDKLIAVHAGGYCVYMLDENDEDVWAEIVPADRVITTYTLKEENGKD